MKNLEILQTKVKNSHDSTYQKTEKRKYLHNYIVENMEACKAE